MIGKTLAHYEIVEKIGAGGMGEVYRARDTSLGRDVAIKVLPDAWAGDPERIVRFEREARTLASLHHSNVATVFGFHEVEGVRFLAMEFVEGDDLAERLARGPIPIDEAIEIARQVAEGLEAAHERGIVHRDLKPANVKVTPDDSAKILDFGLAQAFVGESVDEATLGDTPTVEVAMTRVGTILGTAAYMSPEQARGKPVDRRTDIWAFGCLVYECLAGRRAFAGETVPDLLAAVLNHDPDLDALPDGTPPPVRELLARCLRKDPRQRLRDVGDARVVLEEVRGRIAPPIPAGTVRNRPSRLRLALPIAAAVLLFTLLGVWVWPRLASESRPGDGRLTMTFNVPGISTGTGTWAENPSISPDADAIVYLGGGRLRVRSLDRFQDIEVPGSTNPENHCWSPDGDAIAFVRDRRLWVWNRDSAESRPICSLPGGSGGTNGVVWMNDGRIYFCMYDGGAWAVPATGGEPELALPLEEGEFDFHLPAALPGGTEFVTVAHRFEGKQRVLVYSCGDRRRHTVLEMDEVSAAAYSPTGHLLLTRNWITTDAWAVRYSPESRTVTGEPFPVEPDLVYPSVARNGDIVWAQSDREKLIDLMWVSPDGRWERIPGGAIRGLTGPAVSPDGTRIAYSAVADDNRDVWVMDLDRGTRHRLTSGPNNEERPSWSPDGRWIYFVSWVPGDDTLLRVSAEGGSDPEELGDGSGAAPLADDRFVIIANEPEGESSWNLYLLDLEAGKTTPWLATRFDELAPALSPDGRWLAYESDESGRTEVLVRDVSGDGAAWLVSTAGGSNPMWDPSGAVLYYRSEAGLMKVAVTSGGTFTSGRPERVFSAGGGFPDPDQPGFQVGFGVAPGPRFLIARQSPDDPRAGILFLRGWEPPAR